MRENKPLWKVLLMVCAIAWVVILEFWFVGSNGPTITWLVAHYLPQSLGLALVSILVARLPRHITDAYREAKAIRAFNSRLRKDEDDGQA